MRKYLFSAGFALLVAATSVSMTVMTPPAFASEIKYVVNDIPITSGDIEHRAAFLKLQHKKGDAAPGNDRADAARWPRPSGSASASATRRSTPPIAFASNNKMPLSQLDGVMEKSGVTRTHFKEFIRAQMAWTRLSSARSVPAKAAA